MVIVIVLFAVIFVNYSTCQVFNVIITAIYSIHFYNHFLLLLLYLRFYPSGFKTLRHECKWILSPINVLFILFAKALQGFELFDLCWYKSFHWSQILRVKNRVLALGFAAINRLLSFLSPCRGLSWTNLIAVLC